MTQHEEAVRLTRMFGRTLNFNSGPEFSFMPQQLAALIAKVRRDEREKCAQECENYESAAGSMTCATMLRNKMRMRKGNEWSEA